jgi:CHAT domain-containing protein
LLNYYCESARIVALGNRVGVEEQIDSYLADIADIKGKTSSGHALYSMLLEPIAELGAARHLTLIRDGRLNLLPWDALVDNSNRYLVVVDNISFSPSVSSAILLRAKRPIVTAKAMLAVGGIPYEESDLLVAPSWQN